MKKRILREQATKILETSYHLDTSFFVLRQLAKEVLSALPEVPVPPPQGQVAIEMAVQSAPYTRDEGANTDTLLNPENKTDPLDEEMRTCLRLMKLVAGAPVLQSSKIVAHDQKSMMRLALEGAIGKAQGVNSVLPVVFMQAQLAHYFLIAWGFSRTQSRCDGASY